jgi:hypothetical protein
MALDHRGTTRRVLKMVGLGLAVLLVGVQGAAAAPSVTFQMRAAPIPKSLLEPQRGSWPHTGNLAGMGADLKAHFAISGSEDAGLPNPLRRVVVYLPKGLTVHRSGFAVCSVPIRMASSGLPLCPKNSIAGPVTAQQDTLNFTETNHQPEPIRQGAVFSSGDALNFWSLGTGMGIGVQGINKGSLQPVSGSYGYKLTESFSYRYVLKSAVTGGPILSTGSITVALGAATRRRERLTSYLTMPKTCPAGGLAVKAELSFGKSEAAASWETVSRTARLPCRGMSRAIHATYPRSTHHHRLSPTANCSHPKRVVVRRGKIKPARVYRHVYASIYRDVATWGIQRGSGYVICRARVQLRDGSWVTPRPGSIPQPLLGGPLPSTIAGSYRETGDPRRAIRRVVVTFAKSPVPQGSTCSYPLWATALGGDEKDYRVVWHPDTPAQGEYRFHVMLNNPQVMICGAVVELVENYGEPTERALRVYHPAIGSQGGLSAPVPAPQRPNEEVLVWVFGRLR